MILLHDPRVKYNPQSNCSSASKKWLTLLGDFAWLTTLAPSIGLFWIWGLGTEVDSNGSCIQIK